MGDFFFNELISNSEYENITYYEDKLKDYLKELEYYIPKDISIQKEFLHLKKLFNKFDLLNFLIIVLVTIEIIGLSFLIFSKFLPSLIF